MINLENIIEALLLVSGKQVAVKDIAEKLGVSEKEVNAAADTLKQKYSGNSGIYFLTFNKKLQFASNPAYAQSVSAVLNPIREKELTKSILEVAAIIAYRQPVTKGEIEYIKGIKSSDYSVQILLDLEMIEPVGRKDAVGRPVLYATTDNFLKRFNLESLHDLPDYDMLIGRIKELTGGGDEETYLFQKDDYVEEESGNEESGNFLPGAKEKAEEDAPPASKKIKEKLKQIKEGTPKTAAEEEPDDELPDFLEGEDVITI